YGVTQRERRRRAQSYLAGWHSDLTALVNPTSAAILRAEVVPDFGGDTTWSNLAAAYESLSPPLRVLADNLRAQHHFAAPITNRQGNDEYSNRVSKQPYATVHPVVRVHPETGERSLFVNPMFTSRIIDLSEVESRRLLDLFFEQIARPAFTVRFRWHPNSVAF